MFLKPLRDLLSRPTGFVDITNEGQTGYLNTTLQVFYMLRPVREVGQGAHLIAK